MSRTPLGPTRSPTSRVATLLVGFYRRFRAYNPLLLLGLLLTVLVDLWFPVASWLYVPYVPYFALMFLGNLLAGGRE